MLPGALIGRPQPAQNPNPVLCGMATPQPLVQLLSGKAALCPVALEGPAFSKDSPPPEN